jgi:hypothetical protein
MPNTDLKAYINIVGDKLPNLWRDCYPRRIIPPQGYTNPKIYSAQLSACAMLWQHPEMSLLPHTTCCLNQILQVGMAVPTYFIHPDFARAVANTKLPADFKLSEIKWPLDAMLFVLPDAFVAEYFKFNIPFIAVSKCLEGVYPTLKQTATAKKRGWELKNFTPVMNQGDKLLLHFPCYFKNDMPCDYSGSWPLNLDLSAMKDAPYIDATGFEARYHDLPGGAPEPSDAPAPSQEEALRNLVTLFAIKLMLAFTARPHFIRQGSVARPARARQGVIVRDALWNPNLVGWDYVAPHGGGTGEGTHSSPRMHYRCGHFTNQFIGKRNDPAFVPAASLPRKESDGTIDWDSLKPEVREAFVRNHKLIWTEPVLVGGES